MTLLRSLTLVPALAGVAFSFPQAVPTPAPEVPAARQDGAGIPRELVAMRMTGAMECLVHPKDAGLRRVLEYLDDRLAELPAEVPDFPPMDAAMMRLITDVALGAKTLSMSVDPTIDPGQEVPFRGFLALHAPDADGARALEGRILEALAALGAPELELDAAGQRVLPAPFPMTVGARGTDVVFDLGGVPVTTLAFGDPLIPAAARPQLELRFDYGAMVDMMLAIMEAEGQGVEADMMYEVFTRFGLDQLKLEVAAAADAERAYSVARFVGWAAHMQDLGLLGAATLEPRDFALIPRDATWATVQKVELEGMFDIMLGFATDMMEQQGQSGDPVEMIANMTGFDLRADLIEVMGDTFGIYASDSTGGGGMTSMVLFASLRDAEHALETREKFEDMLNAVAQMQMQGYMQTRQWSVGDVEYSTLTFPGLPVPLEPTIAMTGDWMFVAASPGAALAAVDQAAPGHANLLDNPALQEQLPGGIAGLLSLSYQDTPRLAREGYGMMTMLASSLSNGVRSRTDGLRDAGQVLPPYATLLAGVKPTVSVGRALEGDWVIESRGDASIAVQLTALCGWMQSSGFALMVPAMMLGAAQGAGGPVVFEASDF